jgi:hypothetical protein
MARGDREKGDKGDGRQSDVPGKCISRFKKQKMNTEKLAEK